MDSTEFRLNMDRALTLLRMHFSMRGSLVTIRLTEQQWTDICGLLSPKTRGVR